jgi:hypothetical protein
MLIICEFNGKGVVYFTSACTSEKHNNNKIIELKKWHMEES